MAANLGRLREGRIMENRRVDACVSTKTRFADALDELLRTRPLEKIRVSELCEKAGFSRTTFYDNFHDVFEVPTWLWDYLMSQSLYKMGITVSHYEGHLKQFQTLREHREIFKHAFKSANYNSVYEHGSRTVKDTLIKNASRNAGRGLSKRELLEIEFRNAGAAFMVKQWALKGMNESPEEMTDLFQSCSPQFLIDFLEVPHKPKH
jgi:AraC-like DNA-binding protein